MSRLPRPEPSFPLPLAPGALYVCGLELARGRTWLVGSGMTDEDYMRLALEEARLAAEEGEVPIGAVVVCGGEAIARAHNRRETDRDPSCPRRVLGHVHGGARSRPVASHRLHGLRDA